MIDVTFPRDKADWDAYRAFHTFCGGGGNDFMHKQSTWGGEASPLTLFDTGEVICTETTPGPDKRGDYHSIGVTLTTTSDVPLWMPDGNPVVRAWLDDGGMQYLLVDHATKRAVRLNGAYRRAPRTNYFNPGSPITPGIPHRFQYNCRAYIPGPGMPPIAHEKLKVKIPLAKAGYTQDELEHIHMIVATGQAAMKLTDHEAVQRKASEGANPDVLLKCKTWQDVPDALLPGLAQFGVGRVERLFDYLLTEAK
jgi:hypothetical protein